MTRRPVRDRAVRRRDAALLRLRRAKQTTTVLSVASALLVGTAAARSFPGHAHHASATAPTQETAATPPARRHGVRTGHTRTAAGASGTRHPHAAVRHAHPRPTRTTSTTATRSTPAPAPVTTSTQAAPAPAPATTPAPAPAASASVVSGGS